MSLPGSPYVAYAFEILYSKLHRIRPPLSLSSFKSCYGVPISHRTEKHPLFVTWNIIVGSEKELRGCIGTFSPMEIQSGIKEFALTAAFQDNRFDPIELEELEELSCDITLLKDFEKVEDIWDWDLGTHGIRISFTYHNRLRSATFLPDVAVEQNWDKETTMRYLVAKGGGPRSITDFGKLDISLTRYKGEKSHITYSEFKEIRKRAVSH
ncbi:hypothetical protein DASC09_049180 [Saccharomycopsis crataegensis]|uniref:AMMECR1 domain-containing protein n=1 Tax=Saccharomycopsis crataegensis TaxID=43959 RepID=A0AAV5QRP9_9ASCO|nr:hypothetical protein DASC09_049180 [Saccharomycopsis crataegensis]